jgi:fermentation-respiration switch protein FrsA (DUF1100 family)
MIVGVVGIAVLAMLLAIFVKKTSEPDKFEFKPALPQHHKLASDTYRRSDVFIDIPDAVDGAKLHAWLFTPSNSGSNLSFPIVIMSHGLGAQKDMGLSHYANKFGSHGIAVLIIDYRYFGGSIDKELKIRNFINPWNHVDDIKTTVSYVHHGHLGPSIDSTRIALWGTSFAGGHMLKVAHELGPSMIKGVISQVPHLDGKAASKRGIQQRGLLKTLHLSVLAIADFLWSHVLGFSPIYIKIAGTVKDAAYMLLSEDELKSYFEKHPQTLLGGWLNKAPARTVAVMSLYNPIQSVPHISKDIPILFIAALQDELCPISFVRAAKELAANAELLEIDCTHFNIYYGQPFEHAVSKMNDFLHTVVFR